MSLRDKVLEMVRGMDDDELWGFVSPLLSGDECPIPAAPKKGPGRPKKVVSKGAAEEDEPAPKKQKKGPKKAKGGDEPTGDLDKAIMKFVQKGGCSVSEVAAKVSEDKTKVAAHLKALVEAGQIAKAGERRFTRYGADAKTAKAASLAARGK